MEVGQKVVCINDKWEPWVHDTYNQLPVKGEIYTIRAIRPGRPQLDGGAAVLALLLEEIVNDADFSTVDQTEELGFRASRFAPLNRKTRSHENEEALVVGAPGKTGIF